MRWHRPGLRAQLALALVATSAVTLVAAVGRPRAAARAPPRQRPPARHARAGAHRRPRAGAPAAPRPAPRARRARRRSCASSRGAWAAAWRSSTPTAIELADTDPERREPRSATPERLVDAGFARPATSATRSNGEAVVVARVARAPGAARSCCASRCDDSRAAVGGRARRRCRWRGGGGHRCSPLALGDRAGLRAAAPPASACAATRAGWPTRGSSSRWRSTPTATRSARWRSRWSGCASRLHAEERGRQAFLATASHELRTPLASLRGTVELLEEELARGAPDLGGVRRRAAAARRQIERLTSLAADLLDLGRLDGDAALARRAGRARRAGGDDGRRGRRRAHAAGVGARGRRAGAGVGRGRPAGDRAHPARAARQRAALRAPAGQR